MILVTGASGFIGTHLVSALLAAGHPVRALVRSPGAEAKVREAATAPGAAAAAGAAGAGAPLEVAYGDLSEPGSLKAAAEGCEVVYHLAGSYRGSPAEMQESHVAGTARLLRAADRGARFVYVSSTSVYGWERPWPADERTPPRPESAYGRAKLAAEQLVMARPSGNAVIARPTITYGVGDIRGMPARIVGMLERGMRRFPGTGENRIHLLHVHDLVTGLVTLAGRGDGIFVFAGPEPATVSRIAELLAAGAGLPPPRFGLPPVPLRAAGRAVEAVWSLTGLEGEPPLSRHSVDVATRDRCYSWDKAAAELSWKPAVDVEEGLPEVGAWLKGQRRARRPLPGFEAGAAEAGAAEGGVSALGFDWRGYFEDPDEGLGTVYERFGLASVLDTAMQQSSSESVLHAPLFGMMGIPGLDAVFLARRGVRVGLLDFDAERLEAVRALWEELGLEPETHLVPGPDPAAWPATLDARYDLVFSFAALWWFDDPWAVLGAQARWADRAVLSCVPNKNVFMKMRARLWHRDLFDRLNEQALDAGAMTEAAQALGLAPVDTALFDIPPFPDTSVPLAKVVRAALGTSSEGEAWKWSILPYLKGEQPELEERINRLTVLEQNIPEAVAPALAHHRYVLYSRGFTGTPPARRPSSVLMRRSRGKGA